MKAIFQISYLRNIFFVAVFIALAVPMVGVGYIYPEIHQMIIKAAEEDAVRLTRHMAFMILPDSDLGSIEKIKDAMEGESDELQRYAMDLGFLKLRIYSADGKIIFSTKKTEVGKINQKDYFYKIVAGGEVYSQYVEKNALSAERQKMYKDVVETYVPYSTDGRFQGAIEIYYDVTQRKQNLDQLLRSWTMLSILLSAGLFTVILLVLLKAAKNIRLREAADSALREGETRYRELVQNANVIILKLDSQGSILFLNAFAERFFGLSGQGIVGCDLVDVLVPEEDRVGHPLRRMIKGLRMQDSAQSDFESMNRLKNGDTVWIDWTIKAITDEAGNIVEVLCIGTDATKRHRAEEEIEQYRNSLESLVENRTTELKRSNAQLREEIREREEIEKALRMSENKYRTILENMEEGYYECDLSGRMTFFNQSLARLTGYSKNELLGVDSRRYAMPDMAEKIGQVFTTVYRTGNPAKISDYEILKKNGAMTILEMSVSLIRDRDNRPVGFRGVVRDVQERQKAEEEKRNLETQLRQSQKMQAIGTLAGGIAHDFNNILMSIMQYTDMALRHAPPESKLPRWLEQVMKSSYRARDLISQILTFSRQSEQERRSIRLNPLVKEVMRLIRSTIPANIEIRQTMPKEGLGIMADPTQIHQLLMNLCTNARHAMQENGGILKTGLARVVFHDDAVSRYYNVPPGVYAMLSVSDTGYGMPKEIMERIFDPYFTTKEKGEGTGLGLAVVRGIVDNHGGIINVFSEVGKGTTFRVLLPLAEELTEQEKQPVLDMPSGSERILLVDDEDILVEAIEEMLSTLGYRVTACNSSVNAWDLIQKHPDRFDLVLTDMYMPKMTGLELSRKILEIRPGLPIILCTGFSEVVNSEKAEGIGIKGYLMKPVTAHEMATRIRAVLEDR